MRVKSALNSSPPFTLGKFCFYAKKLEKLEGEEWVKGGEGSAFTLHPPKLLSDRGLCMKGEG